MKLNEIFELLAAGELSQDALGGDKYRDMNPRDYPRVGQAVSIALNALHKRFFLRDGEVILVLDPNIQTYVLSSDFAVSNTQSNEPVKYILDSDFSFEDGVLKVESVHDDDDKPVPLNDLSKAGSIRTLDYRTLLIPPVTETGLTRRVTYRKDHRKLDSRDWDNPEQSEIEIPSSHLEALLYHTASRLLTPLGPDANGINPGMQYFKRYEQAARMLEQQGMQIDRSYESGKFRNRGWI